MAIANCPGFDELAFDCGLMIAIAFPGYAKSSVKKFRSFLASAMIFLSFISIIVVRLSWYVIPLSRSWSSKIRLESYPGTKATLCSLIMLPSANEIEMVSISLVRIICPATVTKSMLLAFVFENSFRLLYRCWEAHESKNHVSAMSNRCNFLAMQAFSTGPGANGFILSELSAFFVAWWTCWGARNLLLLLLSVCPLVLDSPIYANLLSGWRQSRPKLPSLWQL